MKVKLRRFIAARLEARVQRLIREQSVKVVAVTGSVGKTTTKLAVAEVLRHKYRVLAHPGNYNSEIGLPLSIFEIEVPKRLTNPLAWIKVMRRIDAKLAKKFSYDVLVLEMGADEPGDIAKFVRYIKPDIGIVTAIAPAHVEQFGSVDAIAAEKMLLPAASRAVLLNAEDKRVMTEAGKLGEPVQTYGVDVGNVHFEDVERVANLRLRGRLHLHNGEVTEKTNFASRHSLASLACAGAVAEELGLELRQIKAGLEAFKPASGRMQILDGVNGSVILDDSYNSSPRATLAALQTLMELPVTGRRIAVLGSMNELGSMSDSAHKQVGKAAAGVDLLVTVGELANRHLAHTAVSSGLALDKAKPFVSPFEAGEFLRPLLEKGDVVVVKGSQNRVFTEEVVALILADSTDRAKLVRQSVAWRKTKHEQFGV